MLLVRPLLNGIVPFRASTSKYQQQQKQQYRASFVRGCVRLPLRFCCALEYLQVSHYSHRSRRQQFARVWAAKADTGKAESADSSGSKDKQRPDKFERADHKADSKTEARTDGKPDSKPDKSKGSKTEKTEKADQPKSDVSATASQGLKPVHLATFFIILGTGLMFLAVLLWFTADIRFQQACTKVLRRLFKTVALRQVMGILGAMTFVRLGLEPMVKMLRRLFRAPGTWERSSEFYILREVCQAWSADLANVPVRLPLSKTDSHYCDTQHRGRCCTSRCAHNWQSTRCVPYCSRQLSLQSVCIAA